MNEKTITYDDLLDDEKELLRTIIGPKAVVSNEGIPIYLRQDNQPLLVRNYLLPFSAHKEFEKQAKGSKLFRGGATVLVNTNLGLIVAPDERYKWLRAIPSGVAEGYAEGRDLKKTGLRELGEELFVMDLKRRARLYPDGIENVEKFSPFLNLTLDKVEVVGNLEQVDAYFNEENCAFESVFEWDLTQREDFTVVCQEEWALGPGNSGISLMTLELKEQKVTGIFSGQQGLIPFPDYTLHPALRLAQTKLTATA